ncbi:hypothetical protein AT984_12840 [Paucibacter sp. KCTC 42545]|nr:hypothetical protein AT984_12840 [Paucibacter sp. KCTC 42545]
MAVDFEPKDGTPMDARHEMLEHCFRGLAARFRPENYSPTGIGYKAAHLGGKGVPFHDRLAEPTEELVYGHRSTGVNLKLYLKKRDLDCDLPVEQWRVRLEVTAQQGGVSLVGLSRVSALFGFGYRRGFAKLFFIVDRVSVRKRTRWSALRVSRLNRAGAAGWLRAGVNAFGHGPWPEDVLKQSVAAAAWRANRARNKTLDPQPYVFHPHQAAHALIGQALRQLDRRMAPRNSGGNVQADGCKSLLTKEIPAAHPGAITYAPNKPLPEPAV